MTPEAFEKVIVLFVRTVRYWKEWLSLPDSSGQAKPLDLCDPLVTLMRV
jgi:hypothetical protein